MSFDKYFVNLLYLLYMVNKGGIGMTLEEAQSRILELETELSSKENDKQTLQSQLDDFKSKESEWEKEKTRLQQHNLDLFLKLSNPGKADDRQENEKKDEPTKKDWNTFMSEWV